MVKEESQRDPSRIPSLPEKMQLSYDLFRLTNADLAELLRIVERSCASAVARRSHVEEVRHSSPFTHYSLSI